MIGYLALGLFALTIPAANWLIGNVGAECIPNGPCMVPVGFGLLRAQWRAYGRRGARAA